jgi:uncharacterized protein YodC (DUF2158 family)
MLMQMPLTRCREFISTDKIPIFRCHGFSSGDISILQSQPKAFKAQFHIAHGDDSFRGVMMAEQFKAGDVVKAKSGGPKMTVSTVGTKAFSDEPWVWCFWFDGSKKLDGDFPPDALERA